MLKRAKVDGRYYIFIDKHKGVYYPITYNLYSFIFRVRSPSLMLVCTQDELKEGYKTGRITRRW